MKRRSFFWGMLVILIAAATFWACKKSNNSSSSSPMIHMKNSAFASANVQVASGTTVMWTNDDNIVHTVTANDGSFDSGDIQPGSTFSWTFKSIGTFAYHDKHNASMTGVIVVVMSSSGGGGGY